MKHIFLGIILLTIATGTLGQTISADNSYVEEIARINQITGASKSISSFTIRPISIGSDSLLTELALGKQLLRQSKMFTVPSEVWLLPFTLTAEYNLNRPFGYNNGSLYPNRGLQSEISGGFYWKFGVLNVQIKPELVYAQNKAFNTFADIQGHNNEPSLFTAYFNTVNGIDAPERFGNRSLTRFYPGQSKITVQIKNVEAGISTENLWWGPGSQNAIMMSNSAPGFLHATINSVNPLKTAIGSFEWQIIGGVLTQSGYLPTDTAKLIYARNLFLPKPKTNRYISAYTINWQPKWLSGLFLGITEYDYLNIDSTYHSRNLLRKLFPVFIGSSNKANAVTSSSEGDSQDFAFALNVRQILPFYKAEIYFEWARNDRTGGISDFVQEPEHSSAYTFGLRRLFDLPSNRFLQVKMELTHLQDPPTYLLRAEPIWYVHLAAPRDGYTNDGRYIGAGIGPGSNSLTLDVSIQSLPNSSYGLLFERLVHNNDLYYQAFAGTNNFSQHWVDLCYTFYSNLKIKNYVLSMELTPVYSLNYEYAKGDSFNLHSRLNLTYLF